LEKEEREDADVIHFAVQEVAYFAPEAKVMPTYATNILADDPGAPPGWMR